VKTISVRLFLSTGDQLNNCSLAAALRLEERGKVTLERKRDRIIAAHYRKSATFETLARWSQPEELAPRGNCSIRTRPPGGVAECFETEHQGEFDPIIRVWNLKLKGAALNPDTACGFFVKNRVYDAVLLSCAAPFRDPPAGIDRHASIPAPVNAASTGNRKKNKSHARRKALREAKRSGNPQAVPTANIFSEGASYVTASPHCLPS
jgi:hypothetical protein